jgi:hypothetical protein
MTLSYLARNVQSGLRSKARMLRNGYTMGGQKLWSEEETQVLWRYAGDYASMQRALPNRTAVGGSGRGTRTPDTRIMIPLL